MQVAKICDFGTARELDHTTEAGVIGTYAWMAPEVHCDYYVNTCMISAGFVRTVSSLTGYQRGSILQNM